MITVIHPGHDGFSRNDADKTVVVINNRHEILVQSDGHDLLHRCGPSVYGFIFSCPLHFLDRKICGILYGQIKIFFYASQKIARGDRSDITAVFVDQRDRKIVVPVKDLHGLKHGCIIIHIVHFTFRRQKKKYVQNDSSFSRAVKPPFFCID